MKTNVVKPSRIVFLALVMVAIIVLYITKLYDLQIIEGNRRYEESQNSIISTRTVAAARGSILDRYGRLLVTNRTCNNIIVDVQELLYERTNEESNAVILEVVQMMEKFGDSYTDELPITREAPFEYTAMTDIQSTRLAAWKEANNLDPSATAVEVLAAMRSRYEIGNSYTGAEARAIAGVRYEINVRYLINTSDYVFAEDVSMDLISVLKERNIPGFEVETSYVREYNTSYAAHVLGYVGMMNDSELEKYSELGYSMNAYVGKDGVEYAFENYLHGDDGVARVTSTAEGVVTNEVYTKEPVPGNHVYLTLDISLQEACENALNSFITNENAEHTAVNEELDLYGGNEDDYKQMITGGAVAAVNVKTGEPLAIASWPTYELTDFIENYAELLQGENQPLFNRALQGTYAPGSTFKPCVAIAALNEKMITTGTKIECEGIFRKYEDAGYAPRCWIYGQGLHGELMVSEALTVSCNYFFYTLGDYLQISKMVKYATDFGLGQPTGVELYEDVGVMASDQYMQQKEGRDMYAGDTLQAAIGQSDSLFNPLQMAEYCAAIANNGTRHSGSILKSVRSYDYSETLYERETEVLSKVETEQEYYDAVHAGMYGVANDPIAGSTYLEFYDADYTVGAKTGTAQTGSKITNNAVFICYAPYDDPEIAVAVVIEKGGSGAAVASVARQVMDAYFGFRDSSTALESEMTLLK